VEKIAFVIEGLVDGAGEEAGFEAGGAQQGVLGEGDALGPRGHPKEFLSIEGLVGRDKVGLEVGDGVEVFGADDGEGGSGEAVLAGILGGAGLAFRRAGAGRTSGIGAVSRELLLRCSGFRHAVSLIRRVACEMWPAGGRRS